MTPPTAKQGTERGRMGKIRTANKSNRVSTMVKEPMFKFKDSVSSHERAEVMKIIKYNKQGFVYKIALDTYPHLATYFEEVKPITE